MSKSKSSIVVLASRAEEVRRIARELDFKFTESAVPEEPGAIRFAFELSQADTLKLLGLVPQDVYARRAHLQ